MRIALVHMRHAPIGGTELVLDRLSRTLAERGHAVTIVCRSHTQASHPAIRFEVLKRPVVGSAWRMWAFACDVERHFARAEYDVVLGLGKTWTHDVVRTGGGSHATYREAMRGSGAGSWRDLRAVRWLKDALALEIERRAYAPGAYRRVIANSRMVRDDMLRRHAVPPESIDVIHNGVDLERFHPRRRAEGAELRRTLGLSPDDVVFLFLGKGFARKGLDRALEALARIAARHPEARLVVAGDDSSRPKYEALAARLGVADRVRFLGERRDPEACLAASDVHVLPTWYDSFAFSVLEALATGVPVVTTDAAGASELVDDGVLGSVLPAACSADELALALSAWCDRDRVRAAAEPARARAETCGFDTTMGKIADVLTEVARAKTAGATSATIGTSHAAGTSSRPGVSTTTGASSTTTPTGSSPIHVTARAATSTSR